MNRPSPLKLATLCVVAALVAGCIENRTPTVDPDEPGASTGDTPASGAGEGAAADRPGTGMAPVGAPPDEPPSGRPDDSPTDPSTDPTAEDTPPSATCVPTLARIEAPDSATRLGRALFVATSDGAVRRIELAVGAARLGERIDTLSGEPGERGLGRLRRVTETLQARMVTHDDNREIEFINIGGMATGAAPRVLSAHAFGPGDDAFAVSVAQVHLCDGGALVTLDPVHDAAEPVVTQSRTASICDPGDRRVGGAEYLGKLSFAHGNFVPQFWVARVGLWGETTSVADFGFNPSGVHHYGDVVDMVLGETRAVVDVQHPTLFWVVDTTGKGPWLNNPDLPVGRGASMLGVAREAVFFADGDVLRAFDLADTAHPAELGVRWPAFTDAALAAARHAAPALLFADAEYVAVRGRDALFALYDARTGAPIDVVAEPCD